MIHPPLPLPSGRGGFMSMSTERPEEIKKACLTKNMPFY